MHPIHQYWASVLVPYVWVKSLQLSCNIWFWVCIYRWLRARLHYLQCFSNGDTAVLHKAINIIYLTQIHPCLQSYISSTQFPAGFQPMWSNLLAELVAHKVLIEPNTSLYHSPILASLQLPSPYCWFPWALFMIQVVQSKLFITS